MNLTQSVTLRQSVTQLMIEEFWATFPEGAPKHFYHSITRDGVQLSRCDYNTYVFINDEGEQFWSYEEAKGLIDPQFPTVPEFFHAAYLIKTYILKFGLGDWGQDVEFFTPQDWRHKGNKYPTPGSGAIAIMTYNGGTWRSIMTADQGAEIRDGFLFWLGDRGWDYEILNDSALVISMPSVTAYQSPHDVALANYQSASDLFARVPSAANLDALKDAAIELQRLAMIKEKAKQA